VVEYANGKAAERALTELSHTSIKGREIRVRADYQ
jgi:RNA recognition motif-containing protein